MASPAEIARSVANFDDDQIETMQGLFRSWGLLADLSLGDVLFLAPVQNSDEFVVLANVRSSTAPTLYSDDPIGDRHKPANRHLVDSAFRTGQVQHGQVELGPHFPEGSAEVVAAPFGPRDAPYGVVLRERRIRSQELLKLEATYLELAGRLTEMIASGRFPFVAAREPQYGAPRVGDGLLVLDSERRVTFQSPNAVSALHRLGINRNAVGRELATLGLDDSFVRTAHGMSVAVTQEIERGLDVTVVCRCVPLVGDGQVNGSFVLLRDISELKRRDRLLLSKDATIREIHHRVKNNLQTISSLLRLQARRVKSEEGRFALNESVRRIAAIAIVHETLANDSNDDASGDEAPFLDIARPLIRMIEEGLQFPDDPIRFELSGDAGRLPLVRSMPLAVVLTELLQNVVDHAFPTGLSPVGGRLVSVDFQKSDSELVVSVSDNGKGPPEDFEFSQARGLGLTLVNTFVTTELGGRIMMRRGDGPPESPGTVTHLRFPRSWEDRVDGPTIDC